MKYYFKFVGLPFHYYIAENSNLTNATKEVSQYRNDAVLANELISFEDMIEQKDRWMQIKSLSVYEQKETFRAYAANQSTGGLIAEKELGIISIPINKKERIEFLFNLSKEHFNARARGVIWAETKDGFVYGNKKNNKANALFIFEKIELKKLQ